MAKLGVKAVSVLILFLATTNLSSLTKQRDGNQNIKKNLEPVVIQVEKATRGVIYKVNSKPTGSTSTTDLLHVLNRVNDERGPNTRIVVLMDPRVPIDQIWNVDGTAGKAQLTNLHYFVIDHDTEKMVEVKWGPAIPISTNPSLE